MVYLFFKFVKKKGTRALRPMRPPSFATAVTSRHLQSYCCPTFLAVQL
jgi:hypothetical protein